MILVGGMCCGSGKNPLPGNNNLTFFNIELEFFGHFHQFPVGIIHGSCARKSATFEGIDVHEIKKTVGPWGLWAVLSAFLLWYDVRWFQQALWILFCLHTDKKLQLSVMLEGNDMWSSLWENTGIFKKNQCHNWRISIASLLKSQNWVKVKFLKVRQKVSAKNVLKEKRQTLETGHCFTAEVARKRTSKFGDI